MALLTASYARRFVDTKLTDTELQEIIDEIEAEVVRLYGANYVNAETTITKTKRVFGQRYFFIDRKVTSISSVTEESVALVEDTDFELCDDQASLFRSPYGEWFGLVVVVYVPFNDNADRKKVILDLLRLDLARSAMKTEDFDGSYQFSAPDWEVERARVLRRLVIGATP